MDIEVIYQVLDMEPCALCSTNCSVYVRLLSLEEVCTAHADANSTCIRGMQSGKLRHALSGLPPFSIAL